MHITTPNHSLFLATALLPTLTPAMPTYGTLRLHKCTVTSLNPDPFAEAQVRDDTATRAFSSITITTSTGTCLFVDKLSGDFRANLTPVQAGACDGSEGSEGQKWDVITAGRHDDQAETLLVVSALTQACLNFDPRRAAGNQVILFSYGGRADGGGTATDSQLFEFEGGARPLPFSPLNANGTCLSIANGRRWTRHHAMSVVRHKALLLVVLRRRRQRRLMGQPSVREV